MLSRIKHFFSLNQKFSKWKIFLLIVLFLVIFAFGFSFFVSRLLLVDRIISVLPSKPYQGSSIMVFGVDEDPYVKRSDSIIVFFLNEKKDHVGMISIPRDTYIYLNGVGHTKINHTFAKGGVDLLRQAVSQLLNIPIDHYIQVNSQGIADLVDSLGGVDLYIEKDFNYTDSAGGLSIHLKKGETRLSGKEAMEYLRFRHDAMGDIGRVSRQQVFLQALAERMQSAGTFFRLPWVLTQIQDLITTDMSISELVGFSYQFSEAVEQKTFSKTTVPGGPLWKHGVSYWEPDQKKLERTVVENFLGNNRVARRALSMELSGKDLADSLPSETDGVEVLEESTSGAEAKEANIFSELNEKMELQKKKLELEKKAELEKEQEKKLAEEQEKKKAEEKEKKKAEEQEKKKAEEKEKKKAEEQEKKKAEEKEKKLAEEQEKKKAEEKEKKKAEEQEKKKAEEKEKKKAEEQEKKKAKKKVQEKEVTLNSDKKEKVDQPKTLEGPIKLEVLNGLGDFDQTGVAAQLVSKLNIQVSRRANAGRQDYAETKLVIWKGDLARYSALIRYLQIDPTQIVLYDKPEKSIDATLVLGQDWALLKEMIGE